MIDCEVGDAGRDEPDWLLKGVGVIDFDHPYYNDC